MKKLATVFLFFILLLSASAQLKSPDEFLGYKAGEQFTPHYKVADYFNYLSSVSKQIKLQLYGKTYENRPLSIAFVGSEENINKLSEIQSNNLKLSGFQKGDATLDQPCLVWLSYNVHGNEAVSTEAAMQTVYYLLNPAHADAKKWLLNTVVVIDACMNPDGRERYVNFYNSVKNVNPDPLAFTREHIEPWPGGRSNHYYFDLNRDWAWQSQLETQQRMAVYTAWLPQVHVDFHEQGINDPYYFAPAAEPFHQDITSWQRKFQTIIGKNNAKYFDAKHWLYFTKERFDLLYPSYGDTYPTYNGAIGMTYEQGGSGRAGLAVLTKEGDTLTLTNRINHHHISALSTIEATSQNAVKVLTEYKKYFDASRNQPSGIYKSYVIKGGNPEKLNILATLLKRNGIEYGYGSLTTTANGYNYFSRKTETFKIDQTDVVITAYQSKSVLLKVLLEPNTFVSDSITYDITAWALPYAFGLKTYASKEVIKPNTAELPFNKSAFKAKETFIAYAANWNSIADVKFLSALFKKGIKIRYSEVPFNLAGKQMNAGSLLITRTGNEHLKSHFDSVINEIAQREGVTLHGITSGFADKGPDLGSGKIRFMQKPKIAVVGGLESYAVSFGEIWHFFEQQINFPISVIQATDLGRINLYEFNVLIIPDGNYENLSADKLQAWVNDGGKLIAMQGAIAELSGRQGFSISLKADLKVKEKENAATELIPYADRERHVIKTIIPGAVFKVNLDNTHPLAFGYPDYYYTLKLDDKLYHYLNTGWNVGVLKSEAYVTGLVGATTKQKLSNGMVFGVQPSGRGSIVYLAEDPLFRSFWENGKLLFSNAIFMVGE